MNTAEEITTAVSTQRWEQPFRDLLDEIYFPGFAEQLAEEKPDDYATEYFYFLAIYD